MRNQPRNVMGGSEMWAGIVPGLGLMNFILGWISVPIETFLRRDFGERYYTRSNFVAGLIVLWAWSMLGSLLSFVGSLPLISSVVHHGEAAAESVSWLGSIIKWYMIIGLVHFVWIWVKDVMNKPEYSFSAGRSWLTPIGRLLIGFMNLFLNGILRLVAQLVPKHREQILAMQPVLRDVDTFTERFIEPTFVFVVALFCAAAGQTGIFWWLIFSIMALNLHTGQRHQADRSYILDIRDQMIMGRMMREATEGRWAKGSDRIRRMVSDVVKEAEQSPEIIETIKVQNPTLAEAAAALQRKRSKQQNPFSEGDNSEMAMAA
ncbi:hypothetical protein BN8_p06898 (plasmid) [Fibrisoma limi BUZ 3]|uniref:Uncharacterized protein n=1 Tax=Fibrisoma limi BUZ 3 TaxID=1185876 RepID=I2GU88_9BACT|nr:hypothetical protein [Fibrisoma limi]CCH57689.1 hypothetical protein BN8_p06898 [Fibrisoma limi BUZ 3]